MSRMLTVGEVAKRLHLDPSTVRRWIDQGLLPGHRIGKTANRRGVLRIDSDDLERMIQETNIGEKEANQNPKAES